MTTSVEHRERPPAQLPSRLLSSGVDFCDWLRLEARCDRGGEDWVAVCRELGDRNLAHAEEELAKGHRLTARQFFLSAQAAYRVGQYGITELTEEKLDLYRRLTDAFARAAALYDPPLEEVNIPYKGFDMHGWIHWPKGATAPCPVVVMILGATGFKEESILEAQLMVDRGMAVLNIDGPGQGVTRLFNGGCLEVEVEHAYRAMVDHLVADGRFGKIGIVGRSTGGYYVCRAAATDPRIAACVSNGGSYHPEEILKIRPHYLLKFAILSGISEEEMTRVFPRMTLAGLAERIECPLLIIHGSEDPIFPVASVQRIHDEARSTDKTIRIYQGAGHCSFGAETEAYPFMADWIRERLAQAAPGTER